MERADPNDSPATIISLYSFIINMFRYSKLLSYLKLSRGYTVDTLDTAVGAVAGTSGRSHIKRDH